MGHRWNSLPYKKFKKRIKNMNKEKPLNKQIKTFNFIFAGTEK